jgi:hypothetical protein
VVAENIYLLGWGMLIGCACALLAVTPALVERGALPNLSLGLLLAAVPVVGLAASLIAVRAVVKAPLLATLRAE